MYQFMTCPKCQTLNMVSEGIQQFQIHCTQCQTSLLVPPPSQNGKAIMAQRVRLRHRRWFVALIILMTGFILGHFLWPSSAWRNSNVFGGRQATNR